MSGAVALFSYVGTEDEALRSAAWAGERVAEALVGDGGQIVRVQPLTRDGLAAALSGASGFAAFCHGREDALIGGHADARLAVLDRGNAHLLAGRWGYALACRAGVELAGIAVGAGARCFAGYDAAMLMEWSPEDVEAAPPEVREAFARMLSIVPMLFARGAVNEATVRAARQALFDLSGDITEWCDANPGGAPGLEITAQQLHRRLVVLF